MFDYRGVIQKTIEELNEISVKGADNCQRLSSAIYTLTAVVDGMTQERNEEYKALLHKAGGKMPEEKEHKEAE